MTVSVEAPEPEMHGNRSAISCAAWMNGVVTLYGVPRLAIALPRASSGSATCGPPPGGSGWLPDAARTRTRSSRP